MDQVAAGAVAALGGKRLTKAQRMFKKAIQYRKKHGVSLKAAFKAVKGGGDGEGADVVPEVPVATGARRRGGRTRRRGGGVASTAASVGGRRSRRH